MESGKAEVRRTAQPQRFGHPLELEVHALDFETVQEV